MASTNGNPSPMTPEQSKALRRIQRLLADHFKAGLFSVVYAGIDERFHIQVGTMVANKEQALDLARRTLQEVEVMETGIIKSVEFES